MSHCSHQLQIQHRLLMRPNNEKFGLKSCWLFLIVWKFWYLTCQKGNQLNRSIDRFQNHKSLFGHSNQNCTLIRWLRLYHDKRLMRKCDRGHILMIQHFQSFRHQNWKQINDFSLNDSSNLQVTIFSAVRSVIAETHQNFFIRNVESVAGSTVEIEWQIERLSDHFTANYLTHLEIWI